MSIKTRYIMQDQVRGVVPALSAARRPADRLTVRSCLELTVFACAVASYVAALALAA